MPFEFPQGSSKPKRVAVSNAYLIETARRERLSAELDRARRLSFARNVRIDATPDRPQRLLTELPPGIHLKPGELRIEFSDAEDLLRRLYELSQAMVYDFARFRDAVEERQPSTPVARTYFQGPAARGSGIVIYVYTCSNAGDRPKGMCLPDLAE